MIPDFIGDGYEAEGRINANERLGIGSDWVFTYRPVVGGKRERLLALIDDANPASYLYAETAYDESIKMLAKQIVRWNKDAPIDEATMKRLTPNVFRIMRLIVLGLRQSDPAPEGEQTDTTHLTEEADAKN